MAPRRRRIRGSRGPIFIIILLCLFGTAAVFVGKFIQDIFLDNVKSTLSLDGNRKPLPPNPANDRLQMN